jgi:hypothetical protein
MKGRGEAGLRYRLSQAVRTMSIRAALSEQGLSNLLPLLRRAVPDVSQQEFSAQSSFNAYWELKRRGMHAFQCGFLLEAVDRLGPATAVHVVDVGDSAGTHMLCLRALASGRPVKTLSVNLDSRAITQIQARGLPARLCRAEELDVTEPVDIFASFETLEHMHNPALFLHRLALRSDQSRLVLTVPYLRRSRVGLGYVRRPVRNPVHAEEVHVFELCPADWTLLFRHAGWRVVRERVYRHHPAHWPILSSLLAWWWQRSDFEGLWGVELERDRCFADLYMDWES